MINQVKFALASVALATVISATPVFVTAASATDAAPKAAELQDGTKVSIKGEEVFVVGKDGKEAAAPDGTHVLKDGTSVTTKGGKIVK